MERLHLLDLPSPVLNYAICALHIDLIWCYKIIFGLVHINCQEFFFVSRKNLLEVTVTSSANRPTNTNTHLSFFGQRIINVWNSLPDYVDFRSLSSFKRTILLVNFNQFLKVYKFSREQSDILDRSVMCISVILCFVYVFVCFYCFILCNRKVFNHLARVDVSAGNSLFTPQY